MSRFLRCFSLVILTCFSVADADEPPNVVLIFADEAMAKTLRNSSSG